MSLLLKSSTFKTVRFPSLVLTRPKTDETYLKIHVFFFLRGKIIGFKKIDKIYISKPYSFYCLLCLILHSLLPPNSFPNLFTIIFFFRTLRDTSTLYVIFPLGYFNITLVYYLLQECDNRGRSRDDYVFRSEV